MKEIIIARLGQITNSLNNTHRITDEKGDKYIQISNKAATYMAREIQFSSDFLVKDGHKIGRKQSDKSADKGSK